MRAIVVGAGLAGLSAALRLKQAGAETTIVERSRLVGGKATSFTVDGVEVDNGQHVHLACCTAYLELVASVDMAEALYTQPTFAVTVLARGQRAARLRAEPRLPRALRLAPSFARYAHLGFRGKAMLAVALRRLDVPVAGSETFLEWLRRHHQTDDAVRGFWAPFVVPAVNAELHEVSARDALFVVSTAFSDPAAARIGWSRVPLARIAEAVATRAGEVRLRTAVTGLLDDGTRVHGVRCATGEELEADAVVLAIPPSRLAALLGDPAGIGVSGLEAFESRAILDVHLWYEGPAIDLEFAALLDSPVQWVFQKSPGYLACSLSAADALVHRPEAELVDLCQRELAAVLPSLGANRVVRGAVTRDPEATFIPRPGLRRPGPWTRRPNLAIAGAWTDTGWPATMESAVRSGRSAAATLLTRPPSTSTRRRSPELEMAGA